MLRRSWAATGFLIMAIGTIIVEAAWGHPSQIKSHEFHQENVVEVLRSTTTEQFERAKAVAFAKCADRRVDYGPGGNIFTFYTFDVTGTIKGPQRRTIATRLLGGTIGNTTITPAIESNFVVGSEYLLMLGPDNADGYATLNPAAVFAVNVEPGSGRRVLVQLRP